MRNLDDAFRISRRDDTYLLIHLATVVIQLSYQFATTWQIYRSDSTEVNLPPLFFLVVYAPTLV